MNIGVFKKSLLLSSIGLSLIATPSSAVPVEVMREYAASFPKSMNEEVRARIIQALEEVDPQKRDEFVRIAGSLITPDMSTMDHYLVIRALLLVSPQKWNAFDRATAAFLAQYMTRKGRIWIIDALGHVPHEKIDRVYSQFQRLMTVEKNIKLERADAIRMLIRKLQECDTDERCIAFTDQMITLINASPTVNDNALLTHIFTAWGRVYRPSQNEEQELARERQNTHKKEVHASVAKSVSDLKARYKELPQGDIFELIYTHLLNVSQDMGKLLDKATAIAKILLDSQDINSQAIDDLLAINPHARAGENEMDTVLNMAARKLQMDKPENVKNAIQKVVHLHAHKDDLRNAKNFLGFLKTNSTFKDKISQVGYEEALRLIYAAITDTSWGDAEDIPSRWTSLMVRMARAKNEYREGSTACAAGSFNALLDSLSDVHPDVHIVMSLPHLMQEIALEEDDEKFAERTKAALTYLGKDAEKDVDYQQTIKTFTTARQERKDKDAKALETFKNALTMLKDRPHDEFATEAENLSKALPKVVQEMGQTIVEVAWKTRHSEHFTTALQDLKAEDAQDLKRKGKELLEYYPKKYQKHLEDFTLRKLVQAKAKEQDEDFFDAPTW